MDTILIVLTSLVGLIFLALNIPLRKRVPKAYHIKSGAIIPGPSKWQILYSVFISKKHTVELYADRRARYGDVYQAEFLNGMNFVNICNADMARHVFTRDDIYGKAFVATSSKYLVRFLGISMPFVNGEAWKRQRKVASPGFHHQALRNFVPTFHRIGAKLVDKLDENGPAVGDSVPVPVLPWMQKSTVDVLGSALFGYEFHALDNHIDKYMKAYNQIQKLLISPIRFLMPWLDHLPLKSNRDVERNLAVLDEFLLGIAEEYRKSPSSENLVGMMVSQAGDGPDDKLTLQELRDNLVALFLAGHETTSSALSFGLYCLAAYPECQQRAYEEILNVTSDAVEPTYEDLQNLNYVGMFIKEVMRMYPPVTVTPARIVETEDDLCGYRLAKGSVLCINIWNTHYNKAYWPDPHTFDPERFLPERSEGRHPYAWLPFIGGPRVCIGMNFSILEQKMFYVCLLRRFKISLPANFGGLELRRGGVATLQPQDLRLVFTRR